MSVRTIGIPETIKTLTHYFQTFEEREEQFRERAKIIPRLYLGPRVFFSDLMESCDLKSNHKISLVTADPRDCLAFGTPWEVLFAAALSQKNLDPSESLIEAATLFEIADLLRQPIRTLSGGESAKLALAKAYLSRHSCSTLVVSAPYSWLSLNNVKHLNNVASAYRDLDHEVLLLSLSGQDEYTAIPGKDITVDHDLKFTLTAKELRIALDRDADLLNDEAPSFCSFDSFTYELASPCAIVGENGSGKSLFVRSLSRAIPSMGRITVERNGIFGRARLITQDALNQVLSRTIHEIFGSVARVPEGEVVHLYDNLIEAFRNYFIERRMEVPTIGVELDELPRSQFEQSVYKVQPTILQLKFALAAARLASGAVALCIDEPEWALAKESTAGFVWSVMNVAHTRGVALLIVSNKNWWDDICKSKIQVERSAKNWGDSSGIVFSAQISRQ